MAKKILVVLDPGHYPNYNKGAVGGYFEGNKMYDFSEYERDALKKYGIDVILTRGRGNDKELYDRGQVAVKNAKGYDIVVFISNHSNGFDGSAYGVVAYRSQFLPDSAELGQKLVDAVVGVMKPQTGITYSRGVKTRAMSTGADYYGVIRGSVSNAKSEAQAKKGAVDYSFIIEHGFHDNVKECTFLNKAENLKKMAEAEAKVIADYFGLTKSTTTTTKPATTTTTSSTSFKVKIIVDELNYRAGAGTSYKVNGTVKKGEVYTITQTSGSWGKLKSGAGWINISSKYVTRL